MNDSVSKGKQLKTNKTPQKSEQFSEQNDPKKSEYKTNKGLSRSEVMLIEEKEKSKQVQVFGLYFHNQKTLSTFLIFAIGIIIVPLFTYLKVSDFLQNQPEITKNQAQMYSGFISVGVVILFMIGYCVVAITDESNFSHEVRQYNLLSEQEQKRINESKLREAFEENALENGIKEVIKTPNFNNSSQEETSAENKSSINKRKSENKLKGETSQNQTNIEKLEVKSNKKQNIKSNGNSENSLKEKENNAETLIKQQDNANSINPLKQLSQKLKVPKNTLSAKKKDEKQIKVDKTSETFELGTLKKSTQKESASLDSGDDWNIVKVTNSKKITNEEQSLIEKKIKNENQTQIPLILFENNNNDGFITVKPKKTFSPN